MKQVKLASLTFMATLALTGIAAATASAEEKPNILPEATAKAPITGTILSTGATTFGNGILDIEAAKDEGTFEMNNPKLGLFDLLFLEFESVTAGTKCTGLHDTDEGSVLLLGTFHVRDYKEATNLRTALIYLLLPVHFTCGVAVPVLIVLSGCVAGALTPENVLTKVLSVLLKEGSNGKDNAIITVLNEANTKEEACQLLAKEGSGATKLAKLVTHEELLGFLQNSKPIEVLVMPL
jgi:hypothetical protein